jgi:hypothetical protein
MKDIEQSGFSEFDGWRALARRTRELLDAAVLDRVLPAGGADFIAAETLPHIEGIQNGFVGWLRSDAAGISELRYLLGLVAVTRVEPAASNAERRAAAAEQAHEALLATRDGQGVRGAIRGAEPWNLAALAHARLVLALLPAIPDADVRYPAGRRTYSDIPRPRGPAEISSVPPVVVLGISPGVYLFDRPVLQGEYGFARFDWDSARLPNQTALLASIFALSWAKAILVPIAQAVVAIPFVIRAVVPALRSIDPVAS